MHQQNSNYSKRNNNNPSTFSQIHRRRQSQFNQTQSSKSANYENFIPSQINQSVLRSAEYFQSNLEQMQVNHISYGYKNNQAIIKEIQQHNLSPIINPLISQRDQFISDRLGSLHSGQQRQQNEEIFELESYYKPTWRSLVHPEIDELYKQILLKKNIAENEFRGKRQGNRKLRKISQYSEQIQNYLVIDPAQDYHTTQNGSNGQSLEYKTLGNEKTRQNKQKSQVDINTQAEVMDEMKRKYEERISILQHQNRNLKDELFYLRAAILAQYQVKQSKLKEKIEKNN